MKNMCNNAKFGKMCAKMPIKVIAKIVVAGRRQNCVVFERKKNDVYHHIHLEMTWGVFCKVLAPPSTPQHLPRCIGMQCVMANTLFYDRFTTNPPLGPRGWLR